MFAAIFALVGNLASSWFQSQGNQRANKNTQRSETASRAMDQIDADLDQERLKALEKQARPGMKYLQQLIAQDPNQVTPEQQQVIDEGMRDTLRSIPPGLRGSGRTTTAIVRNVEGNTRNKFLTENRKLKVNAAQKLQQMMLPLARDRTGITRRLGNNRRDSTRYAADSYGNMTTGNAVIAGDTAGAAIGAVGDIFGVDTPPPANQPVQADVYGGGNAQGSPADLGGSLGALSSIFARDNDGRKRKYGSSRSNDARLN